MLCYGVMVTDIHYSIADSEYLYSKSVCSSQQTQQFHCPKPCGPNSEVCGDIDNDIISYYFVLYRISIIRFFTYLTYFFC